MKPILFSTEMVRAILSDRKTMTRRVIKDKDITNNFDIDIDGSVYAYIDRETGDSYTPTAIAKYQIGDILWVQETWKVIRLLENMQMQFEYRADGVISKTIDFLLDRFTKFKKFADKNGWQSPYFMPCEAARIFLRVTDVRAERLQDITPFDAWNEGCRIGNSFPWEEHIPELQQQCRDIVFKALWDSTVKKSDLDAYGWNANPWVWVYEFERVSEDGSSKDNL